MLVAVLQQRGDLTLLFWTSFLQSALWGSMTCVYWIKREQGKLTWYSGQLDIWICTILAITWLFGLVLLFLAMCKKGFGGGPSCRLMLYENSLMMLAAALFFIAAVLAVSGRLVLLLAKSVDDVSGWHSFCMGSLLAYIALLLNSVCLLVGRAAIA